MTELNLKPIWHFLHSTGQFLWRLLKLRLWPFLKLSLWPFLKFTFWPFLNRRIWPLLKAPPQLVFKWWFRKLPPNLHSSDYGSIDPPPKLMLRPAYSILPFIRWPLGYQVVHLYQIILIAIFLAIGPPLFEFFFVGFTRAELPLNLGHKYLVAFACLYGIPPLAAVLRKTG